MANDKPLHFLVVDDDQDSRAMIVEYLRSMGHSKITQARDGAEATRMLERDASINFIISDWDMPLMNGLSFLQRVRNNPARAHLPFLITTSPTSAEAEKIVMAAENLVDAYVIKPFRSEVLKEKVDKMLAMSVHGPQKQVVVVDDDEDSRNMIVEYLKELGFKDIQAFPNGKIALDHLQANLDRVGLIVSDWEMPEMSGIELLRNCKFQPKLANVPFLMVTSQSSMERMKVMQAAKANVDHYLLKPFNAGEIKKRVEELLDKARSRHKVQALVSEGLDHLTNARYQRALECFEDAVKLDPDHDVALRGLADCSARISGIEVALPFYKRAIDANPFNPTGYLKLSAVYEQFNWLDKSIALLQAAVQQINFSPELHFALGAIYQKKGQTAQARAEFEKTLEIQSEHKEAREMLKKLSASGPT